MQFTDLRIPIATRMQLTVVGTDYKPQQFPANLLGFRRDVTVLACLGKKPLVPVQHDAHVAVRVGLQSAIVRFESSVQEYIESPFPYLHLSYPNTVVIEQQLRRSPRFPLDLATAVAAQGENARARPVRAQFTDISLNGARLILEKKLPDPSITRVILSSAVFVAGTEQKLQLSAEIKSAPDTREIATAGPFSYGVSFVDMAPQQMLLLQALCYELQVNNPSIIAA